jgi:hypothetical protein
MKVRLNSAAFIALRLQIPGLLGILAGLVVRD